MKLHIGGKISKAGWHILDIEPRPEVDFVAHAAHLDFLPDDSVEIIYASHILEHLCFHLNQELTQTLQEWYRILAPSGKLLVAVPDLEVLCRLFLKPGLGLLDRHYLMVMMFGGQANGYDIHKTGFDAEILAYYLLNVGFTNLERVEEFGLFDDASNLRILDTTISLNIIAYK